MKNFISALVGGLVASILAIVFFEYRYKELDASITKIVASSSNSQYSAGEAVKTLEKMSSANSISTGIILQKLCDIGATEIDIKKGLINGIPFTAPLKDVLKINRCMSDKYLEAVSRKYEGKNKYTIYVFPQFEAAGYYEFLQIPVTLSMAEGSGRSLEVGLSRYIIDSISKEQFFLKYQIQDVEKLLGMNAVYEKNTNIAHFAMPYGCFSALVRDDGSDWKGLKKIRFESKSCAEYVKN